jgi:hypothetical protein
MSVTVCDLASMVVRIEIGGVGDFNSDIWSCVLEPRRIVVVGISGVEGDMSMIAAAFAIKCQINQYSRSKESEGFIVQNLDLDILHRNTRPAYVINLR